MASSLIGSLRVALSLGTADFEAGANKAATIAKTKGREIEGAFSGAKKAIEGLFAAFTIGALTEQIKKSLDYAGSLAEVSRTLGVTTKDLQTLRFAATQSGVAQDELEVGLRRLTVSMGKAELGSKAQAKAFAAIGISLDQLKGKNTGDVFRLMADGLSKVTDRSQRAAIEMTLMGRSGSTLDNLLAPGTARLNALAQAAQQLGIVLSDDQIQNAEVTAHKLEQLKTVLDANIAGVVADNAKSIYEFADAVAHLVAQLPNAVQQLKSFYANFLNFSADVSEKIDQAVEHPLNRFNPLTAPFRGGAMHENRLANIKADRAEAAGIKAEVHDQSIRSFFAQQSARFGPGPQGRLDPPPAGTDVPKFLAGGEGRKKRTPADRSDEVEIQFAQEERQADLQIIEAKKALSHDYVEQTTLSIQALDIQKEIRDADLDRKVQKAKQDLTEGKITQAAYDQVVSDTAIIKAKNNTLDHLQRQALLEAEQEQRFHDVAALDQQRLELQKQHLEDELALATTADRRRDLELQILAIDYQIQKAKLDEVLADTQVSDHDKEMARRAFQQFSHDQGLKQQGVALQNQGPLGQYLNSLPTTAAKWTEALQSVAVDGFGAITNSADVLAGKIVKVGGIFGDVTRTILADLLKIELQKMVIAPLANALSGLLGGSGLGQSLFPVVNGVDPLAPLPGHALGGSIRLGGNMGTDRNVISLNGVPIARTSYGETASFGSGGGGGMTVIQNFENNFAGGAATQDDVLRMGIAAKQGAIDAFSEKLRRRS